MLHFVPGERVAQSSYFAERPPPGVAGHGGSDYRLLPQNKVLHPAPGIWADAIAYFDEHGIAPACELRPVVAGQLPQLLDAVR